MSLGVPCSEEASEGEEGKEEGEGEESSDDEEAMVRGRRGSVVPYFRLDGKTKPKDRQAMMDRFNDTACKVGGACSEQSPPARLVGLTLSRAPLQVLWGCSAPAPSLLT